MKAPVTVALVGIGGYGEFYLDALLNDPRAVNTRLVGVVDSASQRCTRIHELRARGCPVHQALGSLLDTSRPELLVIAAPDAPARAMTCAAHSPRRERAVRKAAGGQPGRRAARRRHAAAVDIVRGDRLPVVVQRRRAAPQARRDGWRARPARAVAVDRLLPARPRVLHA